MMLEWKTATGTEVPDKFLSMLSSGLYDYREDHESTPHPYEELIANLAQFASKATISLPGGGSFELGGRELKRAAQKAQVAEQKPSQPA